MVEKYDKKHVFYHIFRITSHKKYIKPFGFIYFLCSDINGVPLSVLIKTGNIHDINFIEQHINDIVIVNKKNIKHNKYILLADKAYESKKIRNNISKLNYSIMIPKKTNAIKTYTFNKLLYKKRIFIEHTFQKLKTFRRIAIRYDSLIDTYFAFVYLAISHIIYNKI
jgi:transposase